MNTIIKFTRFKQLIAPILSQLDPNIKRLICKYHTTPQRRGLMEFFDDEKNWGVQEVKVGRAWRKEELRIKSNSDLHKLWYVLLKERNMLLTMEEECKNQLEYFPNPERIDKVEESMLHLEEVVRERNRAYWELEIGETGEVPKKTVPCDIFDWKTVSCEEHTIPASVNPDYIESALAYSDETKREFHALYDELQNDAKEKDFKLKEKEVIEILQHLPTVTREAIEENYPEVDIDKLKNVKESYGHYDPEIRDPLLK